MHADDALKIAHLHFGERLVAEDAGIVDENVDPAPFFFGARDHCRDLFEIGNIGAVGHRDAAGGSDLFDDLQRAVRGVPEPPQQSSLVLQLAPVAAHGVLTQ